MSPQVCDMIENIAEMITLCFIMWLIIRSIDTSDE